MKFLLLTTLFLFPYPAIVQAQEVNTVMLDKLFDSLEERDEAMGSITLMKNGSIIYERAIGIRDIRDGVFLPSNSETNYKIWSITKTYIATIIFQLIEDGTLSLDTTLDQFHPQIPNAENISIRDMLGHKSGIFDYVNDLSDESNVSKSNFKSTIDFIASFKPNFNPGEDFRYSNSNYLILGLIIEEIDNSTLEASIFNRISTKIDLSSTLLGNRLIYDLENKAETFQFNKSWVRSPEEQSYDGHVSTGDGGIISTTRDMAVFIDALFNGQLISENSLDEMRSGNSFYGLGLQKLNYRGNTIYGHTGAWVSESSLFYYPEEGLSIAYATNGIVLPKEEILNYVLSIYSGDSFGISANKKVQSILITLFFLLIFGTIFWKSSFSFTPKLYIKIGLYISCLYWLGYVIAGIINGYHNFIKDDFILLNAFYSKSGTFFSVIEYSMALLIIPFFSGLYYTCRKLEKSILPLVPLLLFALSMIGISIFPNQSLPIIISANLMLLTILGPILSIILWRNGILKPLSQFSTIPLLIMILSSSFMMLRPAYPEFIFNNFGLIQSALFLGITMWIASLSIYFSKLIRRKDLA